jgi:phosphatidylglycerol:prolipoprotein diacylglycerol transferase
MSYPKGTVPTTDTVHPTPIYETLAMGIVAMILWSQRDRLGGGRLFALYLVLAGIERLLVEFIRRNKDVALGLTLPQLLSIGMIAFGIALAARVRPAAPQPA